MASSSLESMSIIERLLTATATATSSLDAELFLDDLVTADSDDSVDGNKESFGTVFSLFFFVRLSIGLISTVVNNDDAIFDD